MKINFPDELKSHISIIETAFFFANHACIILDLLGPSLYEELKRNNFQGFSLRYIQKVFQSILPVLNGLSALQLIHCDVKPENILICHGNHDALADSNKNSTGKNNGNVSNNDIQAIKADDNDPQESKSSDLSSSLIVDINSKNDDLSSFDLADISNESHPGSYSYSTSVIHTVDHGTNTNDEDRPILKKVISKNSPQLNNDNNNSMQNKRENSYDNIGFKLIDFGSCLFVGDNQDYLQSRYYRAPEILLRLPYDSKIDIWSLGCLAVEMMLGVPILPAQSELHLATLIEKTIGPFPRHMFENSPRSTQIFMPDGKVKPASLLCEENGEDFATTFVPYFVKKKLRKIIMNYESVQPGNDIRDREVFIDLIQKMLTIDPDQRISAFEAMNHPFLHMNFRS